MAFLNKEELQSLGFKKIGKNVLISGKASFYGQQNIVIGDNTYQTSTRLAGWRQLTWPV